MVVVGSAVVIGAAAAVVVGAGGAAGARATGPGGGAGGAGGGGARVRTCPESDETISQDSSTASKALAGTRLSSSTKAIGHDESAVPPKYQLLPLSARISP